MGDGTSKSSGRESTVGDVTLARAKERGTRIHATTERLAPEAAEEAQAVLDRAARRLLKASLDLDTPRPAARSHLGDSDDGADEVASLVERELLVTFPGGPHRSHRRPEQEG